MGISVDFDVDAADSWEVFSPLQQILATDTLIKKVDIVVRFQIQEPRFLHWGGSMRSHEIHRNWSAPYFPTELIPKSDLDLFNYLCSIQTMPVAKAEIESRKEKATPEQLKEIQAWGNTFHLPVDSPEVQSLLAGTRAKAAQASQEKQQRELQKIFSSYLQVIREMNQTRAPKELSEIEITVSFAKESDFNRNSLASYHATKHQVGQWSVHQP